MDNIPLSYKAAQLIAFNQPLEITELPIPLLQEGEVLIKVMVTLIHPYDAKTIDGTLSRKVELPRVAGFEGSGIVIKTHESVQNLKIGTRVGFMTTTKYGCYAQYSVAHISTIIPLFDTTTFEEGAALIGNPVTVMLQYEEAKALNAKVVIQSAAASALGRMLFRYFKQNNIEVINIVRREDQENVLKSEGAKYIINSSSNTFIKDLQNIIEELNPTIFFDAVAGELNEQIVNLLPCGSTVFVYGLLSGQPVSVQPGVLISKFLTIKGFNMFSSNQPFNPMKNDEAKQKLQQEIKTSLKTVISQEFPLEKINDAFQEQKKNATIGKIIIRPNKN